MLALPNKRWNGGLSFHIFPVTQFRPPINWQSDFRLHRRQDHQLREVFLPQRTPWIPLSRRHFSAGPVEFRTFHVQLFKLCFRQEEREINAVEKGVDLNGRLRKRRQGAYSHCVVRQTDLLVRDGNLVGLASGFVLGKHVPDPVRVDVKSDFNLRHATWRWRYPIEMELPKQIVVPSHRTLSLEDLNENTWLVVSVRCERLSFLRGNCDVAFDELRHDTTCRLQAH